MTPMTNRESNGLTKYRIDQVEKKVDELSANVELIMNNHLAHIKEDLIGLKTRVNLMTAINIGGIILGIVLAKILK